jgi:Kdo2-lipid IVA lauroyltransferase/acyltransferase
VKKFRYWLEWILVRFFAGLIPQMPLKFVRWLASLAGSVVYYCDSKSRAVAIANLEAAFGRQMSLKERQRIAKRSLQIFGQTFLELFWTPRLNSKNVERFIRFEDPQMFQTLFEKGDPIIAVTPHFGNFEWGSALFGFVGYRGMILTQRFKNDRLTEIFARLRSFSGHDVVTQESSVLRLLKTLRRGRPIGVLTDLTLKIKDPAVIVEAFGMKTRVTLAHSILHERTQIPIVPFITVPRPDGGYSIRLLPPLRFAKGTPYETIAQACWDQFEPIIREQPEQWLWSYKHWRYKPSGTDRIYPFYSNRSKKFDAELAEFDAKAETRIAVEESGPVGQEPS